jgi:SAM-dependent methyltransferase
MDDELLSLFSRRCVIAFLGATAVMGGFLFHNCHTVPKRAQRDHSNKTRCAKHPGYPGCLPHLSKPNLSKDRVWNAVLKDVAPDHYMHMACDSSQIEQCYGEPSIEGIYQLTAAMRKSACALQSDSVIYDIGSGYGRLATYLFLKERAQQVKGIEINECRGGAAVELADAVKGAVAGGPDADQMGQLTLMTGDVRALGFADATHIFLSSQCWSAALLSEVYGRLAQASPKLQCIVNFARGRPLGFERSIDELAETWGHVVGSKFVPTTWGGATATFIKRGGCKAEGVPKRTCISEVLEAHHKDGMYFGMNLTEIINNFEQEAPRPGGKRRGHG